MQPEHVTVTRRDLRAAAAAAEQASRRSPGSALVPATLDGLRLATRLTAATRSRAGALVARATALTASRPATAAPGGTATRASLRAAHRPNPRVPSLAALRTIAPADLAGQLLGGLRTVVARPGCVVLLSAAFLAGGITQVHAEQTARDEHRAAAIAAAAAAERAEAAHLRRVVTAESTRMTEQGVAYAALRRNEALAAARAAIDTAGAVVVVAAPVVAAEQMSPLDAATAQLAQLVAAAPAPDTVIEQPRTIATQAIAAMHDGETPRTAATAPTPLDPADVAAAVVAEDRASEDTARSAAPTARAEAPTAPLAASYVHPRTPLSAVADVAAPAAEPAPTGDAADDPSGTADAPAALPAPLGSRATMEALDLDLTAQVVAAAEQVVTLSAQVEATAQANIAAAQAAAAAAAAAEAAARAAEAARAEQSRRVEMVRSADNGNLPVEALCGVDFQRGVQLRCDAAAALEQLNVAFRNHFGRDLDVVSSYRDYGSQVSVKAAKGGLAAAPGTSNHGWGLAVDFDDFGSLGQFDRPTYRWMRENAGTYGWHHPSYMRPGGAGPAEPWHWEYGTTD